MVSWWCCIGLSALLLSVLSSGGLGEVCPEAQFYFFESAISDGADYLTALSESMKTKDVFHPAVNDVVHVGDDIECLDGLGCGVNATIRCWRSSSCLAFSVDQQSERCCLKSKADPVEALQQSRDGANNTCFYIKLGLPIPLPLPPSMCPRMTGANFTSGKLGNYVFPVDATCFRNDDHRIASSRFRTDVFSAAILIDYYRRVTCFVNESTSVKRIFGRPPSTCFWSVPPISLCDPNVRDYIAREPRQRSTVVMSLWNYDIPAQEHKCTNFVNTRDLQHQLLYGRGEQSLFVGRYVTVDFLKKLVCGVTPLRFLPSPLYSDPVRVPRSAGICLLRRIMISSPPAPPGPPTSTKLGCYISSYGRGVGKVIRACANGTERNGALCYPYCREGYDGVGPVCWQRCPAGFTNTGAHCLKNDGSYGRGTGHFSRSNCEEHKVCEADPSDPRRQVCRPRGPGSCEKNGLIWYPRCRQGYVNRGCCICSKSCPYHGLGRDIGVSCEKKTYGRGWGDVLGCEEGEEMDGLLCYPSCREGFNGVGPVCWGRCSGHRLYTYSCGAFCTTDENACGEATKSLALGAFHLFASFFIPNPKGVAAASVKLANFFISMDGKC